MKINKSLMLLFAAMMAISASIGCTNVVTPVEREDSTVADQDFAFSVAIQKTVQDAHADEMAAINSQAEILGEIHTTLTAMAANVAAKDEAVKAAEYQASKIMLDDWPKNIRVVYWTGEPCTFCEKQEPVIAILEDAGIQVRRIMAFEVIDGESKYAPEATEFGITDCPRVWLCRDNFKLAEFIGVATLEQLLDKAKAVKGVQVKQVSKSTDSAGTCTCECKDGVCLCQEDGKTCTCIDENGNPCRCSRTVTSEIAWQNVPETWPARAPIDGSNYPTKATLLYHLRGGGNGGQNHVSGYYHAFPLDQMTVGQLVTLHDSDHPVTTASQSTRQIQYSTGYSNGMNVRFRSNSNCRNGRCR